MNRKTVLEQKDRKLFFLLLFIYLFSREDKWRPPQYARLNQNLSIPYAHSSCPQHSGGYSYWS